MAADIEDDRPTYVQQLGPMEVEGAPLEFDDDERATWATGVLAELEQGDR